MKLFGEIDIPEGSTHFRVSSWGSRPGGAVLVALIFFKQEEGGWHLWRTDSDDEYPRWVRTSFAYKVGVFESKVLPKLLETPKP